MKRIVVLILAVFSLSSCNRNKVYHEYIDFDNRIWLASESARFRFEIKDTLASYNIYCNLRNSTQYPWSRIFVNFVLSDTTGNPIQGKMISEYLFEPKTGKPYGKSGLGDLYDHQISILSGHRFSGSGPYEVKFDQFMRTDSLSGILSVGLSVEKLQP